MRSASFLIWLILGAIPGYFGMQYYNEARGYIARAIETPATISQFQYEDAGRADHTDNDFRMWVDFKYTDGSTIGAPTNVSGKNDTHRIGEQITILYDPNFVNVVRVKSFFSLYLLPTVLLGLAGIMWCFGLWRRFR